LKHPGGLCVDCSVELELLTVEEDHQALPKVSEHMGPSARENCWKCRQKSVVNPATRHGAYQTGYISGEVFTAEKKTNQSSRAFSLEVQAGRKNRSEYGIGPPSIITQMNPHFNVVHGHPIEFFHKFLIVSFFSSKPHRTQLIFS
jgi:hypothetical protein